jgi:hypothetical protein
MTYVHREILSSFAVYDDRMNRIYRIHQVLKPFVRHETLSRDDLCPS